MPGRVEEELLSITGFEGYNPGDIDNRIDSTHIVVDILLNVINWYWTHIVLLSKNTKYTNYAIDCIPEQCESSTPKAE